MISNPYDIDPCDVPDEFQLELIDIHNDSNLKTTYDQHDLVTFNKQHVSSQSFPHLAKHVRWHVVLFGTHMAVNSFFPH